MSQRSKNGTAGYSVLPEIWNAIMPSWTFEDGKLTEVKLFTVDLHMEKSRAQKGLPTLSYSEKWLEYLAELSKPYGTEIQIRDGVGYVKL